MNRAQMGTIHPVYAWSIGALGTGLVLCCIGLYWTKITDNHATGAPIFAKFGDSSLRIDYATTTIARERGMGGRTTIEKNSGMLFIFDSSALYGFWMKDTLVPLDIFWLDESGRVVSISQDVATSSYPHVFYPSVPVRYVLETTAGFSRMHQVATGTALLLKDFPIVSK